MQASKEDLALRRLRDGQGDISGESTKQHRTTEQCAKAREQQQRGPGKEDPAENRAFAYTQRDDFKEFPPSVTTHPISPSVREEI